MAALTPTQIIEYIIDAIEQSGWSAILTSTPGQHPKKFVVSKDNNEFILWVYAWTLTPGGRPELINEYRIQMTSVASPLLLNPNGFTILIGFEPTLKMFAGFDIKLHQTFTSGSPSVQINIEALRDALQDGLSFRKKSNEEITIGIRPDQFVNYTINSDDLHKYGKKKGILKLLGKASSLKAIKPVEVSNLSDVRQRIVQTVSYLARTANFREQVLRAYDHRCAVTKLQLRLVDAAHILPVAVPQSPDSVINGIALSPTLHRAFDNGLIYLNQNYEMKINPKKEIYFKLHRLDGGIEEIRQHMGKILLPPDKQQWPKPEYINRANKYRNIDIA